MDMSRTTLPAQPYAFVRRDCAFEAGAIRYAVETGFGDLFGALGRGGIAPQSPPMAVYHEMPSGGRMKFACAVAIGEEDAEQAPAGIETGILPGGDAMKALHLGPYDRIGDSHARLCERIVGDGFTPGLPVWEIYLDDPARVAPDKLRTEIVRPLQRQTA